MSWFVWTKGLANIVVASDTVNQIDSRQRNFSSRQSSCSGKCDLRLKYGLMFKALFFFHNTLGHGIFSRPTRVV